MTEQAINARDYEVFVEATIRELEEFRGAVIHRNRRFAGVRQPGTYEIDIAVEHDLGGRLKLFYLIECKRLSRRVDRPAVQKLAQTRDALSAHKAIIASASGFTDEAILVAENLGIALWTLSEGQFLVVRGMAPISADRRLVDFRTAMTAVFCDTGEKPRMRWPISIANGPSAAAARMMRAGALPKHSRPGVDPRSGRYGVILTILQRIDAGRAVDQDADAVAKMVVAKMAAEGFDYSFDTLVETYANG